MTSETLSDDVFATLKIIVIGNSNSGKSSLLRRYVDDDFDMNQRATIGFDYRVKRLKIDHSLVQLSLHDTAGAERFRALTGNFYRNAHCVILVYDVTDRVTFAALDSWLDEVEQYSGHSEHVVIVVGNKVDLAAEREVTRAEGATFARLHRTMFIETSALTSECVEQAFEELVRKALDTPGLWRKQEGVIRPSNKDTQSRSWYCCYVV